MMWRREMLSGTGLRRIILTACPMGVPATRPGAVDALSQQSPFLAKLGSERQRGTRDKQRSLYHGERRGDQRGSRYTPAPSAWKDCG